MRAGVIGGGLAGLVAGYDLISAGAQVTLFNPATTLGGQIRTRRESGFIIEDGAEGWVAGDPDVRALCESLAISSEIIPQLERRSLSLAHGTLTGMGAGTAARALGIQAKDSDLGQGIVSLRHGMAALTESLARSIQPGTTWKLDRAISTVAPHAGGWRVVARDGESWHFDAIVVAVPAAVAAGMLAEVTPAGARALMSVESASNLSVSVGFERRSVRHPLDASGFVVDAGEDLEELRACAFSSSKFEGRAAEGRVLLRAFFRPSAPTAAQPDSTWADRAVRLLTPVLGINRPPLGTWIARWPDALPQYASTHRAIVEEVANQLRQSGRIELAGSSFVPGGIPGAVRSGRLAAGRLLAA